MYDLRCRDVDYYVVLWLCIDMYVSDLITYSLVKNLITVAYTNLTLTLLLEIGEEWRD